MRTQLIQALLAHAQGDLQRHLANIEIYLENPSGIGDHSDVMGAIENEINQVAKYQDQISVIERFLK